MGVNILNLFLIIGKVLAMLNPYRVELGSRKNIILPNRKNKG
jgi:hypothetical protein